MYVDCRVMHFIFCCTEYRDTYVRCVQYAFTNFFKCCFLGRIISNTYLLWFRKLWCKISNYWKIGKKTPRPPSHYLFVDRNLFVIQDELIASTDYNLSTTNRVMNENTLYNNKHIEDFLKILFSRYCLSWRKKNTHSHKKRCAVIQVFGINSEYDQQRR